MEPKETPIPAGFQKDSVTGYLERTDGTDITPKHKSAFLKLFKKCGDRTRSIESQGFTYTELEWHLNNDPIFKSDFRKTLLAMKHELEGIMYESAFKSNGHRERQSWLETHFPEEYGKKVAPKGPKSKSKIDTLLENL